MKKIVILALKFKRILLLIQILITRLFLPCFLIIFSISNIRAQESTKQRSVLSISGSSRSVTSQNNQYYIKQIIGQSGITGNISNNNNTLIQGFLRPNIPKAKATAANKLDVLIETIPYSGSYKIVLKDCENEDINVALFNMIGQKIYSRKFNQSNEFVINLDPYNVGCYIIYIETNQKQYTTKLLKIN